MRYKKETITFQQKPLKYVIMKCDEKAKKERKRVNKRTMQTNIKYVGQCSLKVEGKLSINSIQETVRIIDGIKAERNQLKKKLKYYDIIDLEARNAFPSKKISATVIKCASRYNHYRVRYAMINKDLIEEACLRFNETET